MGQDEDSDEDEDEDEDEGSGDGEGAATPAPELMGADNQRVGDGKEVASPVSSIAILITVLNLHSGLNDNPDLQDQKEESKKDREDRKDRKDRKDKKKRGASSSSDEDEDGSGHDGPSDPEVQSVSDVVRKCKVSLRFMLKRNLCCCSHHKILVLRCLRRLGLCAGCCFSG